MGIRSVAQCILNLVLDSIEWPVLRPVWYILGKAASVHFEQETGRNVE
jgi:hypothetical protein